jgi:protein-ribulosamine 3-kinase
MESEFFNYLQSELGKLFGNSFQMQGKEMVGGGCISRSAKLKTTEGDFFLKWNPSVSPDLFVREAEGLTELKLAAHNELVIPKVILAAKAGRWPGFIALEFLTTGHSHNQAEKLGSGLATLHQYQDRQFGFYSDNYCGSTPQKNEWQSNWTDFFINNRLIFLLDMLAEGRRYNAAERKVFDRLIDKLPGLLPASSQPSLIHGDLWSGNYLYTGEGPALIDPAAYFADREMELAMMSLFGGFSPSTWNAYQSAFPLEPGWEERVQIYQLYHLLNHYYLFGGSYGHQSLSVAKKFAG